MVQSVKKDHQRLIQLSTRRNEELSYLENWEARLAKGEAYLKKMDGVDCVVPFP